MNSSFPVKTTGVCGSCGRFVVFRVVVATLVVLVQKVVGFLVEGFFEGLLEVDDGRVEVGRSEVGRSDVGLVDSGLGENGF